MSELSVGITSTREGLTSPQLHTLALLLFTLRRMGATSFRHGDCVGGDQQGAASAKEHGYRIIGHPPINGRLRAHFPSDDELAPLEYHDRNREIDSKSYVLLACPASMQRQTGGTWWTIRHARQMRSMYTPEARKPLIIIAPDGTVSS